MYVNKLKSRFIDMLDYIFYKSSCNLCYFNPGVWLLVAGGGLATPTLDQGPLK